MEEWKSAVRAPSFRVIPWHLPYIIYTRICIVYMDSRSLNLTIYTVIWLYITWGGGTAVAQWLRCCATNRKVAGPIPDGVIGIFH